MADSRALVISFEEASVDTLLGLVPSGRPADVIILGVAADEVGADVRALPAEEILAVPQVSSITEPDVVGSLLRDRIARAGLVVLDSSQAGRDLAGWLAIELDLPIVWAVDAIRLEDGRMLADRVVLGGSHRLVHELDYGIPPLVLGKPTIPASAQDRSKVGPAELIESVDEPSESRVRVLQHSNGGAEGVPLAAARTVISVGRGIKGPEHVDLFRELASRVGAALGASRVAVDSGWVPFAHQVGQTGNAVAPDLYVAFGISGAIQHLAGMRASGSVVAVNTDLEAPMCRLADVVINADAVEVAEGLLARLDGEN